MFSAPIVTSPYIIRETAKGIERIRLEDELMTRREIFLTNIVNAGTMSCLMKQLMYLSKSEPEKEISRLMTMMHSRELDAMMFELEITNPASTTAARYRALRTMKRAETTDSCIRGILATHLDPLCFDGALKMYSDPDKVDFSALGRRKTALFLTVSDTDRSMDKLANAFVTQALQCLCRSADKDFPQHRLPIPVRFYLDDFATNLVIPDFDKLISVIRSREIYVSVILQSVTQLESLYGQASARTIINNCDQTLYLGGQDIDTARLISERCNKPLHSILSMPLDKAYLLIRGQPPQLAEKYQLTEKPAGKRSPKAADPSPEAV